MATLNSAVATEGPDLSGKMRSLLSSRVWLPVFVVIAVALVCLSGRDGLQNLHDRWRYEDEYGYGFLIIALMPLLVWRRWPLIMATSGGARWPGLVILMAAQLCTVVAALGKSYYLTQLSFFIGLLGIALVAFGSKTIRIFLPLALLLLLTAPLPYTLQAMLTVKLQLLSTNIGVAIIQLLGIPVLADGNIIDLGTFKLQVVEACSGLRYLLPLTCIGFIIAYLYKAPFWKKAFIVISATPMTVAINSFRLAITALLVDRFGGQMAEGFLHEFEGMVIFLVGVALLALEILALEGFRWSRINIESILDRQVSGKYTIEPFRSALSPVLAILICAGTLWATTSIASAFNSLPSVTRKSFGEFPEQIGVWTGHSQLLEQDVVKSLKATDYYMGDFVEGRGNPSVNLFVAYYESLSKGAAIHSPRVCLPGSGWEFATFQERNFSDIASGMSGTYNYVVVQKGQDRMLMYYWFQQRERQTANEFSMKYYLLVDSFFKSRKDGALVRLMTPIGSTAGERGEAQANGRLQAFAHAVLSKMPAYLPQ